MQATVEVWTGGSKRQPVNVGNVIGHVLHVAIYDTLNRVCGSPYGKYCENTGWQSFDTHYLERPPAGIKSGVTWFRTTSAQWANDDVRRIMINIVARTLAAYTLQPLGTNCYEVPGQGRYCNVPQFVRVCDTSQQATEQILIETGPLAKHEPRRSRPTQ